MDAQPASCAERLICSFAAGFAFRRDEEISSSVSAREG